MTVEKQSAHDLTVRRAALPEIMFAADVGIATGLPDYVAEPAMKASRFGPYFTIHGRAAILRIELLKRLGEVAALRGSQGAKELLP